MEFKRTALYEKGVIPSRVQWVKSHLIYVLIIALQLLEID